MGVTHSGHWHVVLNMESHDRWELQVKRPLSTLCPGTSTETKPSPLLDAESKHEKDSAGHHSDDESGRARSRVSHQDEAAELYGSCCAKDRAINLHHWNLSWVRWLAPSKQMPYCDDAIGGHGPKSQKYANI